MATKQTKKAKKNTAKKSTAQKATPKTQKPKQTKPIYIKRQSLAVVLFALALLTLCIALIPGETGNAWHMLFCALRGVFGLCAFAVPLLLGYVAVTAAQEKPVGTITKRVWQSVTLLMLISTLLEIFTVDVTSGYGSAIVAAYQRGAMLFDSGAINGGALGALLGYPLECWFGDIGAKIIVILLLFVFLMLMTGATLLTLWRPVKKTADFTREKVTQTRQKMDDAYLQAQEQRVKNADSKPKSRIDIEMGEGYGENVKQKGTKKRFEDVVKEMQEEGSDTKVSLDDLIGKNVTPSEEFSEEPSEEIEKLSKAEIAQALAEVSGEIEEQAPVKESYTYPSIDLLKEAVRVDDSQAKEEMRNNAELLVRTLNEFGISTKVVDIARGPAVTRYELQPNAGVKISRITGLSDDIALRLAATGVRIEAPIPGKAAIGVEVPNKVVSPVCLRELIDSDEFSKEKSHLTIALGRDISGRVVTADLAKMPHLLIAGTTGAGKSVCTNSMIQSILFRSSPEEVRMLLIDPKQVEFGVYNGIPHLLVPVVTDPRKAAGALGWAVTEMLERYKLFAENNVRDLTAYNELAKVSDTLSTKPLILIVIDELSDLMMAAGKEVEDSIVRLAQMARAAGMHLVIATQRPSANVITGLIKANIPSRLALTVASSVDSRIILDASGAEKLLGRGDMLFHPVGMAKPLRIQGCFVSDKEVEAVVSFLKESSSSEYDEKVEQEIERQAEKAEKANSKAEEDASFDEADEMLPQAIELVINAGEASTSLLQRRLRLGYARAGRLIDEMEQRGIVGEYAGSKPRQVLITKDQWLEMKMSRSDMGE